MLSCSREKQARRLFDVPALGAGATAKQVQTMARHADASTTQIYVHDYERRRNPAEGFIERFLEG